MTSWDEASAKSRRIFREHRTRVVQTRVTETEHDALERIAASQNTTVSELVRERLAPLFRKAGVR